MIVWYSLLAALFATGVAGIAYGYLKPDHEGYLQAFVVLLGFVTALVSGVAALVSWVIT